MTDQRSTDEQLMQSVREGDVDKLGVLFDRHHARVHALCARVTRRADVADDLAQETFLRVLRYRESFRQESAFSTWLYRLAYNVCADYWEKEQRHHAIDEPAPAHQSTPTIDERHVVLDEAMARLAPDRRAVLVLSRYHDLGYDDVARVLDCTPATARVRAHRAIAELRDIYRELERQHAMRPSSRSDRR